MSVTGSRSAQLARAPVAPGYGCLHAEPKELLDDASADAEWSLLSRRVISFHLCRRARSLADLPRRSSKHTTSSIPGPCRGIPSNRILEHLHGTVRDEKIWRSRKHLTASLSMGKHASLQGAAITRDLSPTHVGDVASWTTGGSWRRACAPDDCRPCASLNNQTGSFFYPDRPDGERLLPSSLALSQLT
jgi:hypothetical protein